MEGVKPLFNLLCELRRSSRRRDQEILMIPYLKFIYRFLKGFMKFLFIYIPLEIIGWVLLGVYLPIEFKFNLHPKNDKLPKYLRWFDNADIYSEFGRDSTTYTQQVYPKGWFVRYTWLAFRNPLNYFSYKYSSVIPKKDIQLLYTAILPERETNSDPTWVSIGDGSNDVAGYMHTEFLIDGKLYYEYYYVKTYLFRGEKKCFRFRLGHKIGLAANIKRGKAIQDCFIIQPYKTYSGK